MSVLRRIANVNVDDMREELLRDGIAEEFDGVLYFRDSEVPVAKLFEFYRENPEATTGDLLARFRDVSPLRLGLTTGIAGRMTKDE